MQINSTRPSNALYLRLRNGTRHFINMSDFTIKQCVKDSLRYVASGTMLDVWLCAVELVHVISLLLLLLKAQVSLEHLKGMMYHLKAWKQ